MVSTDRLLLSHTIVVLLLLLFFASPTSSFPPFTFLVGSVDEMNEIYRFAIRVYYNFLFGRVDYPDMFYYIQGLAVAIRVVDNMGSMQYKVYIRVSTDDSMANLLMVFTMQGQWFRPPYNALENHHLIYDSIGAKLFPIPGGHH
ncbi:hypothetical protein AXF42_Ash009553 [Apostasia shenzhenica]|uniref:Cystatin domain-containing protein n=1 Tax=Apostasia shenzhenica TaxID=1088818 RepID=A0A2I0B964_9ASPA|nr:hypothetical protein AXF42_Ash009553 [Apostasia shenzhenica]